MEDSEIQKKGELGSAQKKITRMVSIRGLIVAVNAAVIILNLLFLQW
jgi:hypothetical protein